MRRDKILAQLLVAETNHTGDMILLEASRRVAAELLRRATERGNVFEIPGRPELASRLGMTRETLTRHLSDLQKRRIITIEIRKVEILDLTQLADLVG